MRDNKYRILLMYIFIVVRATNLPKFASISQIFLKVHQILVFSSFFLPKMARLSCYVVFFKELESIAQKLQNIFTWNKKQMKDNKYRILLMYIFIVVRLTNLPKFASISHIFLKVHQILVFSSFFFAKDG